MAFVAQQLTDNAHESGNVAPDAASVWFIVGVLGQGVWSSRFVLQWWISEQQGRSVLPPSFFVLSIFGAVLLCVYAVSRLDYVMITAYALNPIPYIRNLVLIRRRRAEGAEVERSGG